MSHANIDVQRVRTTDELDALEPEWQALEQSSGNTLPFRTFAWTASWWRHMRQERWALRDELSIRVVREDGRVVAVAPLVRTERPNVGPVRTRSLSFVGAAPNMTEVRGTLCEPGHEAACYRALRDDIERDLAADVDWVHWTGLDERGGGCAALGSASWWGPGVVSCELDLPSSWEELKSSRPRNLKESLRKGYNSLARSGHAWAFEVVTDGPALEPALQDFFRLHAARAAMADATRHADVFQHPASRAFLSDVCERFARAGALRVFRLEVDGKVAATRLGFALGGCMYLYYSGFDPARAELGVMTTAVAEAIRYSIDSGMRQANLSTGIDTSKTRWRPRQVTFRDAWLVSDRTSSWLKLEAHRSARSWMLAPGPRAGPAWLRATWEAAHRRVSRLAS
jgi:CelD/BcsL family acetyltransferase involved in cellulose biosynthesis